MFILTIWLVKYTFSELHLNKANASDTEAAFLDLHLSISNDIVSTKIYNKLDDFEIVNFPFLDVDVHWRCLCYHFVLFTDHIDYIKNYIGVDYVTIFSCLQHYS